jgi:uncharacterized repeat protein (TIGR03843 family)
MPNLRLTLQSEDGEARELEVRPWNVDDALALLKSAEITGSQLVPWGSNYTFAVLLEGEDGEEHLAIYKPCAGERPLWDFPDGTLYLRETAAFELSRMLGWDLVAPTVVREGPHGIGSLQMFIDAEDESAQSERFWRRRHPEIERMVLFDFITNNADRKVGHCLRDRTGKVWGIDHGLTFNVMPRLRTMLWQFTNQPVSRELQDDLFNLWAAWESVNETLAPYLAEDERLMLRQRVERFINDPVYPALNPERNIPYGW